MANGSRVASCYTTSMATDAAILAGLLDATRGRQYSIDHACTVLGWSVDRYLDALAALYAVRTR